MQVDVFYLINWGSGSFHRQFLGESHSRENNAKKANLLNNHTTEKLPSGNPMFYMETSAKETGQGSLFIIYKHPAQAIGRTPRLSSTLIPPSSYGRICPEKALVVHFLLSSLQTLLDNWRFLFTSFSKEVCFLYETWVNKFCKEILSTGKQAQEGYFILSKNHKF